MNDASAEKIFIWRTVASASTSLLLLSFLAFCFFQMTQRQIDSVTIDQSSEWGRYVFEQTGFSTICISSHVASRRNNDYISVVGRNRPNSWFEEMGFEGIDELEMHVNTFTDTLPDEDHPRRIVVLTHPKLQPEPISYLPNEGMLILRP